LAELTTEYSPAGPTERHLVEELATVMWRQQRVLLAEAACYRRGLKDAMRPNFNEVIPRALAHTGTSPDTDRVVDAVAAADADTAAEYEDLATDEAMTDRALKLLAKGTDCAYDLALAALRDDTREWWTRCLEGDTDDTDGETYQATAEDLGRFLETEVLEWYADHRRTLDNRPLIRSQAFGEATEPNRLVNLARYETHLDRKLERTLAMLLKVQDMRRSLPPPA
jgi:hypothetical protein